MNCILNTASRGAILSVSAKLSFSILRFSLKKILSKLVQVWLNNLPYVILVILTILPQEKHYLIRASQGLTMERSVELLGMSWIKTAPPLQRVKGGRETPNLLTAH